MKFVKRHGYGIGLWSYLEKDKSCSSYLSFKVNTIELMDKYFGNPRNFEASNTSDEPVDENGMDYCYHGFMRGLQLLDILYTIWLTIDDFVEVLDDFIFANWFTSYLRLFFQIDLELREAYINTVFRSPNSKIKKLIKDILPCPSPEYPIHFAHQLILRKWLG